MLGVGGADLHLAARGAWVAYGDVGALLLWPDYGQLGAGLWRLTTWQQRAGISVWVQPATDAVRAVRKAATSGALGALNRWDMLGAGEIPLAHGTRVSLSASGATLAALCTLLAQSESARDRLADAQRVARLCEALKTRALPAHGHKLGVRRRTVEVLTAMDKLGIVHPIDGRPMPGERPDPPEVLLDRVLASVAHNPWADGDIDRADALELIRAEYTDVEPWPFEALAD